MQRRRIELEMPIAGQKNAILIVASSISLSSDSCHRNTGHFLRSHTIVGSTASYVGPDRSLPGLVAQNFLADEHLQDTRLLGA